MSEQPSIVSILRAMALNYGKRGHSWDHLDGEAVTKAADQIDALHAEAEALRAENGRLQLASNCYRATLRSVRKDIRDDITRGGMAESWNGVAETITVVLEQGETATPAPEVQAEQGERQEAVAVITVDAMGFISAEMIKGPNLARTARYCARAIAYTPPHSQARTCGGWWRRWRHAARNLRP